MFFFKKHRNISKYVSGTLYKKQIIDEGYIPKNTFKEFGFYLNYISNIELQISRKIIIEGRFIKDIAKNPREGNFQKHLTGNT